MIDFLMWLQLTESINSDSSINPLKVPVPVILFSNDMKIKIPAYLFNHLILCIDEIGNNGLDFLLIGFMFMLDHGKVDIGVLVILFLIVLMGLFHIFIFIRNKQTWWLYLRYEEAH